MATSEKKLSTDGGTKKEHDKKVAEEKAQEKQEKKAASQRKDVIEAFMNLSPKDRSALYTELSKAVNNDNDLLSQGKEPGNEHYEALIGE